MHYYQTVDCDVGIQEAEVIAGFVGQYFVAAEAEIAKVGQTSKEVVVAAAAAAAIFAKTVAAVVAPRCFVETFESLKDLVASSVAGFVEAPAVKIVVIVSVAAVSVRYSVAGLSVDEIVSHVVWMSVGMHSYLLFGYFAGVGYFPGATAVVAEAERKLVVAAVETDL